MAKIVFQRVISDFLSNFPVVNLQIKSIVEFTSHNVVHSINEKNIRFTQKYAFLGKKSVFQKFSNFSESVGRTLLTPLAFWKKLI